MNNTKVLLIEDNPGDARLVREALHEADATKVQLVHCSSLGEGVRHLEQEGADLVLLDLGLPDASGLEALAELDRVSPRTPVIVLTGLDDDTTALQALRYGAQDHLVKGKVSGAALLRSARYALERQRTVNLRADLLKGLARQLKAPVDALVASVQVLVDAGDSTLTERQASMLERVLSTAEMLRRFHDGMLDLARADEGPLRHEISGLGGARVVEHIKRRMANGSAAADGNGFDGAHSNGDALRSVESDAPLRLLLLEDNPGDARLVQEILAETSIPIEVESSGSLSDSMRRLETESYDVILVDLGLPDASALESVCETARLAPRSSLIVLTGRDDDHTALESLKKGAQDYLIKGQVDADVLARSIRFARERQKTINLRAELLEAVARELRNPIHVVLGYAHLLLEKIPDPLTPQQAQTLGNVLATTRTLRRLGDAMLDLANAEKGLLRDELRSAGATEVIEEIKRRMAHLLATGGDRDPTPLRQPTAPRPDAARAAGPGLVHRLLRRFRTKPKQVLLIEPDYDSRTIIRTALESGAFGVVEATKEPEVLGHLVSEKIALAVIQRQTPELAAPQVFDQLCKVAAFFEVPLLFLDNSEDSNGARKLTPDYSISTPFTPEQLLFAVDHVLGRA